MALNLCSLCFLPVGWWGVCSRHPPTRDSPRWHSTWHTPLRGRPCQENTAQPQSLPLFHPKEVQKWTCQSPERHTAPRAESASGWHVCHPLCRVLPHTHLAAWHSQRHRVSGPNWWLLLLWSICGQIGLYTCANGTYQHTHKCCFSVDLNQWNFLMLTWRYFMLDNYFLLMWVKIWAFIYSSDTGWLQQTAFLLTTKVSLLNRGALLQWYFSNSRGQILNVST